MYGLGLCKYTVKYFYIKYNIYIYIYIYIIKIRLKTKKGFGLIAFAT